MMELTTQNRGDSPFEITQALHTYFTVGDITQTQITGLEGFTYNDKTDESREKSDLIPITIEAETDRVYLTDGQSIKILNDALKRHIRIESEGSKSTVVWNPWIRVCEQKADLARDDYKKTVCIETANAGNDAITVHPGESHTLKAVYTLINPFQLQA